MKEKIIRILRIILFDAFKSRWAWRRVPAEMFLNYMNKKKAKKLDEAPLPDIYQVSYKKAENNKFKNTLIIMFSPTKFELTTYFDNMFNRLHIKHERNENVINTLKFTYYIPQQEELVVYLKHFILSNNYNKVITIGESAQGFVSLLFAHILSGKCPYVQFYAMPFVPAVELFSDINHHWVKNLIEIFGDRDPNMIETIKRTGKQNYLAKKLQIPRQNLFVYLIVGCFKERDCYNAFRLRKCKYLKILDELETSAHNLYPFLTLSDKYVSDRKKLFNFFRMLKEDEKIYADDDKSADALEKSRYKNGKRLSSLNELIYELITTGKITALYK